MIDGKFVNLTSMMIGLLNRLLGLPDSEHFQEKYGHNVLKLSYYICKIIAGVGGLD